MTKKFLTVSSRGAKALMAEDGHQIESDTFHL